MVETEHIIAVIDARLNDLQKVRSLLAGGGDKPTVLVSEFGMVRDVKPKRVMSAQGRANIAAAQKKRRRLAMQQIPIGGNSGLHRP